MSCRKYKKSASYINCKTRQNDCKLWQECAQLCKNCDQEKVCDELMVNTCEQRIINLYQEYKYSKRNLVSNILDAAKYLDPNVVNSWGIVFRNNILYIANNGSGLITVYNNKGLKIHEPITVPGGKPTGIVYCDEFNYPISPSCSRATLLISTENGTIVAYNPLINECKSYL